MSGTSKHGLMPEASEEARDADAAATGNEGEGREADAAATGNESDYFPEEGDDTTDGGGTDRTAGGRGGADPATEKKKKKSVAPRKDGRRNCSPTSQIRSLRSRQVAYHWRLQRLPQGTTCK